MRKLSSIAVFAVFTLLSVAVQSYVAQGRGGAAQPTRVRHHAGRTDISIWERSRK